MAGKQDDNDPSGRIKDSAQQIWLAGLGAFARAQREGGKVFDALVKDGAGLQKKTQQAAEETLAHAQVRMSGFANEFGERAAGQWGKLENMFEQRVAKALDKIGMPSVAEFGALRARMAELEARLGAKAARAQSARRDSKPSSRRRPPKP